MRKIDSEFGEIEVSEEIADIIDPSSLLKKSVLEQVENIEAKQTNSDAICVILEISNILDSVATETIFIGLLCSHSFTQKSRTIQFLLPEYKNDFLMKKVFKDTKIIKISFLKNNEQQIIQEGSFNIEEFGFEISGNQTKVKLTIDI